MIKLCNSNAWKFYMQLKYINRKFRPKYFSSVMVHFRNINKPIQEHSQCAVSH